MKHVSGSWMDNTKGVVGQLTSCHRIPKAKDLGCSQRRWISEGYVVALLKVVGIEPLSDLQSAPGT